MGVFVSIRESQVTYKSTNNSIITNPPGYLAVVSAVAFSLWNQMIRHNPIVKVSLYLFLIPIFGVMLSVLLLQEALKTSILIGVALVSVAIFIVHYDFRHFVRNQVKI
jgi:drug/metabolite transporter (DMT)-like permease